MTAKKSAPKAADKPAPEKAMIENTAAAEPQPADESFVMRGAVTTTGALAESADTSGEDLLQAAAAEEPAVAAGAHDEHPRDELAFSIDPATGASLATAAGLAEAHEKMNALDAKQRAAAKKD